jgi:hypothetical protein
VFVSFKKSVRASKRKQHFAITTMNRLIMLKEVIAVYSEKRKKSVNKNAELFIFKAGGTYIYTKLSGLIILSFNAL